MINIRELIEPLVTMIAIVVVVVIVTMGVVGGLRWIEPQKECCPVDTQDLITSDVG